MTRRSSSPSNRTVLILLLATVLLAALYLTTGEDPLGLFTDPTPTPPPVVVGSGGDWWNVYFTDPTRTAGTENLAGTPAEKLIEQIDMAQRSIHVAAFEFNLTPVAEALIDAQQRGVEVLWITDDEYGLEADEEEGHGQFAMLREADITVREDDRSALMHNKFWIFDEQTVWTGSTNITENGMLRNNNNVIVIRSSRLAEIYEDEFQEMWWGDFGPRSPSQVDKQRLIINDTSVQVLFAAEDEVMQQLVPMVQNAQESIHLMAFSFTHPDLGEAILERAQAGVEVQGIFETRGSETQYSQLPNLYCAGLPVRQDGNPATFHHKVIVIDGQTVVTGSYNFSLNADEENDENVVIVSHRDIAQAYLDEFQRQWALAGPPDAEDMECD